MNKIVAVLGIIVLLTLGALFFCVGFFTGTNMSPILQATDQASTVDNTNESRVSPNDIDTLLDSKSESLSEKIKDIISTATETASTAADVISEHNPFHSDIEENISINALLREIASAHTTGDDCSIEKTHIQMAAPKPNNMQQEMLGKKIVFIGYFKNNVAVQIQLLLTSKGYKTHVEMSRTGERDESFVFCGPFRHDKSAQKLLKWLKKHNFKEARIVRVAKAKVEETIYDFIHDDSSLPENDEKNDSPDEHATPQNTTAAGQTPIDNAQFQQQQPIQQQNAMMNMQYPQQQMAPMTQQMVQQY